MIPNKTVKWIVWVSALGLATWCMTTPMDSDIYYAIGVLIFLCVIRLDMQSQINMLKRKIEGE